MGILAAGERQVRHHLGPGVHVDPEEHLELEAGPLTRGDDLGQATCHAPDLLEMPGRGRQVHHRPIPRVGHGDDRRHDAGSVTQALEDAERPLEDLSHLDEQRAHR